MRTYDRVSDRKDKTRWFNGFSPHRRRRRGMKYHAKCYANYTPLRFDLFHDRNRFVSFLIAERMKKKNY